ncbi:hypothetical protein [Halalkalirubrum salinum]|uniref:hypothetical protein n=1 Tax=Halalkalirubrum salinum TaxID=2563889 RepID=UPI0010FB801B|nr:hypothetical protein [Halalkalirubrum salinum]
MSTYLSVLRLLAEGTSPERIAVELDRREDAIRGMLETMRRRNHVHRVDCEDSACAACPMADACGPMDSPVQYIVSANGWELIDSSTANR